MRSHVLNSFQIVIAVLTFSVLVSACSRGDSEQKRKFIIGFAPMNVEMTWVKFAYHAMHKNADWVGIGLITIEQGQSCRNCSTLSYFD